VIGFAIKAAQIATGASPARGRNQPDADMMAAVQRAADFIQGGGRTPPGPIFASSDVTILENFAPYLFAGPAAVSHWSREMQAHLVGLTALRYRFGEAHDFSRTGDQVFFSLPTIWSGIAHGRPFTESGGWAFLLTKTDREWRVRSYAWAVIESSQE
jgi:hypothetical protein